jgi:hypothetical protein
MEIIIYFVLTAMSGIFCAWYANKHGDSFGEWLVLGLIYPPFVSIPAVLFCVNTTPIASKSS